MNSAIKVGMAFAGAAAIAVGGTAFTASNTVPSNMAAAYGSSTATGVIYSQMNITPAANPTYLGSVVYNVTGTGGVANVSNIAGWSYQLSNGDGATVIDADCSAVVHQSGEPLADDYTVVTCEPATATTTTLASITNLGLTATQDKTA